LFNKIRFAEERDIPALSEIWRICFCDSEDYINFFYSETRGQVTAAVYTVDDRPVSMLHWFDASFTDGTERLDAKFLYAGGSLPEYRKNGYYTALFKYVENYAKENCCAIFGKPVRADIIPYYKTLGFEPDACLKIVTIYPEKKEALTLRPLLPEDYNRMRDRAFCSHPYVKWSDRYVRFCVAENAFFGGRTLALDLDGSEHFLMCNVQNETLRVIETDMSPDQLRRAAGALCESFSAKHIKAFLPDYCCFEGEEFVSSIVYNAPLRNTYVNLILM